MRGRKGERRRNGGEKEEGEERMKEKKKDKMKTVLYRTAAKKKQNIYWSLSNAHPPCCDGRWESATTCTAIVALSVPLTWTCQVREMRMTVKRMLLEWIVLHQHSSHQPLLMPSNQSASKDHIHTASQACVKQICTLGRWTAG